ELGPVLEQRELVVDDVDRRGHVDRSVHRHPATEGIVMLALALFLLLVAGEKPAGGAPCERRDDGQGRAGGLCARLALCLPALPSVCPGHSPRSSLSTRRSPRVVTQNVAGS